MSRSDFTTVRVVGGLLPPDLLGRVLAGDRDLGGITGNLREGDCIEMDGRTGTVRRLPVPAGGEAP